MNSINNVVVLAYLHPNGQIMSASAWGTYERCVGAPANRGPICGHGQAKEDKGAQEDCLLPLVIQKWSKKDSIGDPELLNPREDGAL